jgi:hypothetical protein
MEMGKGGIIVHVVKNIFIGIIKIGLFVRQKERYLDLENEKG